MTAAVRIDRENGDYILRLDGQRRDAARARSFLETLLPRLGWEVVADDASLLVTELVANVALHARTPCSVRVSVEVSLLRIAVVDESPVLPHVQSFSDEATTGRGLRLVEHVADSWGAEVHGGGKIVWFSFDTPLDAAVGAPPGRHEPRQRDAGPDADTLDLDSLLAALTQVRDDDRGGPVDRAGPVGPSHRTHRTHRTHRADSPGPARPVPVG